MEREMDAERDLALVIAPSGHQDQSILDAPIQEDKETYGAWNAAYLHWIESKRRKSGSENTVRAYELAFRQFFVEWAGVPPWQITSAHAQSWAVHLEQVKKASLNTLSLKLAALSSFYDYVLTKHRIPTLDGREESLWPADRGNPFLVVERPKVSAYGQASFPSTEESERILGLVNTDTLYGKRDYALLVTFLTTCRRSNELLGLRWGDIRPLPDGDYAFTHEQKAKSDRVEAWMPRECHQAICAYLEADGRPPEEMEAADFIFIPVDPERIRRFPQFRDVEIDPNRPISNGTANQILKKYARRAGVDLKDAHLHGLRHAGARRRIELDKAAGRQINLLGLKDLLGHTNVNTTQIYADSVLTDPEDPGGREAAQAWITGGQHERRKRRRRRRKEPPGEQVELPGLDG